MLVCIRSIGVDSSLDDVEIPIENKNVRVKDLKNSISVKLKAPVNQQNLYFGGKQLADERKILDYGVQEGQVIQLRICSTVADQNMKDEVSTPEPETESELVEGESLFYRIGDKIDYMNPEGAWFEAKIHRILKILNPFNLDPSDDEGLEENIRFQIIMDRDEETVPISAKFSEIRPRSYKKYSLEELETGMKVLVNYNFTSPGELGYWYDFEITRISKRLSGTIFVGALVRKEGCIIKNHKEILRIEHPVLLTDSQNLMPRYEKRSLPLYCTRCRDKANRRCKFCGCKLCSEKTSVTSMIICEECGFAFHLFCLDPPLSDIPPGDCLEDLEVKFTKRRVGYLKIYFTVLLLTGSLAYTLHIPQVVEHFKSIKLLGSTYQCHDIGYCPTCKTDKSEVIKPEDEQYLSESPGVEDQIMNIYPEIASMDVFGPIPGIRVGMTWKFRFQLVNERLHRSLTAPICYSETEGAYSMILAGENSKDTDNGDEIYFSGQSFVEDDPKDGRLQANGALFLNCSRPEGLVDMSFFIDVDWRKGKPIRVMRSSLHRAYSRFAPKEGVRYDGIYKVVEFFPTYYEHADSKRKVMTFFLKRDDPNPAPWAKNSESFEVIRPKNGSSEPMRYNNLEIETSDCLQPVKTYRRTCELYRQHARLKRMIEKDTRNEKLWIDCIEILDKYRDNYTTFSQQIQKTFKCNSCLDLCWRPVTTRCGHNFCKECIVKSFKQYKIHSCPVCRVEFHKHEVFEVNQVLKKILEKLFLIKE